MGAGCPIAKRTAEDTGCDITLEASEPCPAIGMLRPRSGAAQWLAAESYDFLPHLRTTEYVDAFGNLCQRFVVPSGLQRIRVAATVDTDDEIATQAEPRGGRVVLAYGRDAADVAFISNYGPLETTRMKVWVEHDDRHDPNAPGPAQ